MKTRAEPSLSARSKGDSTSLFRSVDELESWLGEEPTNEIVGNSIGIRRVLNQAKKYAASSAPVMITGESGTGKEGVARRIHEWSERSDATYARVNCAALSEGLLESELFGHERGAFTGAVSQHIGRFEWAAGGTLLLDEISEIPPTFQAKLLRVLEENEFQRVGSNKTHVADVRVVATSNRELEQEVRKGNFRHDLYYRINVLQVQMPPLRERVDDIPSLVLHFLKLFRHEGDQAVTHVVAEAMQRMMDYHWPGNIRELRNVVHRSAVLADSAVLTLSDLPHFTADRPNVDDDNDLLSMSLLDAEKHIILAAIDRCRGNKSAAARQLGISTRTLHSKLSRYAA